MHALGLPFAAPAVPGARTPPDWEARVAAAIAFLEAHDREVTEIEGVPGRYRLAGKVRSAEQLVELATRLEIAEKARAGLRQTPPAAAAPTFSRAEFEAILAHCLNAQVALRLRRRDIVELPNFDQVTDAEIRDPKSGRLRLDRATHKLIFTRDRMRALEQLIERFERALGWDAPTPRREVWA